MKEKGKRFLGIGSIFVVGFVIWTVLIQRVDVQTLGVNGTDIGFATINCWFHQLTGVHMEIYTITDWLGLVPIFICMIFGGCIFRKNCASVPEERSAIPLQTEQSSASLLVAIIYSTIPARKFKTICLGCHSA